MHAYYIDVYLYVYVYVYVRVYVYVYVYVSVYVYIYMCVWGGGGGVTNLLCAISLKSLNGNFFAVTPNEIVGFVLQSIVNSILPLYKNYQGNKKWNIFVDEDVRTAGIIIIMCKKHVTVYMNLKKTPLSTD